MRHDEGRLPPEPTIAEYQAAGLYDPTAPNAAERLALLQWLSGRGVSIDQMLRRSRRPGGTLTGLAGDLMVNPGAHLRLAEVAERAGLTVAEVEAIRRTAGLAPVDPEEPRFADRDVQSFAATAVGSQLFGVQATRHFGRVMGSSLARIAEAVVSVFLTNIEGPILEAHGTELQLAQANLRAVEAAEAVPPVLQSVFRAHLEESIRRFRLAREGSTGTVRFAVGFVDLVGFTARSRHMTPRELTDTIERFESTAHDTATAKGGRVVKLIGDEAMFVAIDAGSACDIALTLVEHFAGDPAVTPRGGLTYGALVNRGGDYYGPVVNLAARLAELAVPNELLVTPELAAKVHDPRLRFEPAGRRLPKGFDEPVSLLTLERP
jgi:class 3 adenylate cyclase